MNGKYKMTLYACYLAYVVQGIINNINPIIREAWESPWTRSGFLSL